VLKQIGSDLPKVIKELEVKHKSYFQKIQAAVNDSLNAYHFRKGE
jgi:hypothetical protein